MPCIPSSLSDPSHGFLTSWCSAMPLIPPAPQPESRSLIHSTLSPDSQQSGTDAHTAICRRLATVEKRLPETAQNTEPSALPNGTRGAGTAVSHHRAACSGLYTGSAHAEVQTVVIGGSGHRSMCAWPPRQSDMSQWASQMTDRRTWVPRVLGDSSCLPSP